MRLGTAIERLFDNYVYASDKEWINDKVAWALYQTWKEADIRKADTPQTETQTETQNSNLTFEKDECAKEYEELGLKELKELIEADRKTENSSEKPNNSKERSSE